MKWFFVILFLLSTQQAFSDTPPPAFIKIKGGTDGTIQGNVSDSSKVNVTNAITVALPTGASTSALQTTGNSSLASILSTLASPAQEHITSVNPNSCRLTDGTTFYKGTTPSDTQPVSVASLPLPTGAATSGNQVTANASLSSIDSKLTSPLDVTGSFFQATQPVSASALPLPSGASTSALQSTTITTLGSPFQTGGSIGNTAFGISGTLPAYSSTPTFNLGTLNGASTAANQVTAQASLSSIDSKLTSPLTVNSTLQTGTNSIGTVVQTALVTGSISNNAAITTAASSFTAPANAIGFILEAESGNTDNIRWAVGSTATASVGMLAEPGRDSGYIPLAANISVIAISGTQSASVQWVVR